MSSIADIEQAIISKKYPRVVSCPLEPVMVPGTVADVAIAAGDCLGTIFEIVVPPSGIIYSATLWDLDDEALQIDLEIFKRSITELGDNTVWDCPTEEGLHFITELSFVSFDDHLSLQTSELTNIGKAYTAPEGKFYIQAVGRGASDIALGLAPRVQLQILSDDPNWQER